MNEVEKLFQVFNGGSTAERGAIVKWLREEAHKRKCEELLSAADRIAACCHHDPAGEE